MAWSQLHLVAPREHVAAVENALLDAGALSITLGDERDAPILEPGIGETPLWPEVHLCALFAADRDRDEALRLIRSACAGVAANLRWENVQDRAWEREWLQFFTPTRFGTRLWVCPGDASVEGEGALVLRLDPGLAFGTGTHPSTALCLEWLDAHPPEGLAVVDYGCGSGILALASLLLGARSVDAVDNDPQALIATRDNARRNALDTPRLRVHEANGFAARGVDLIVANILAGALIELAPRFAAMLATGGSAVIAGILGAQAGAVRAAYARWFDCTGDASREDWCRLELRRKPGPER